MNGQNLQQETVDNKSLSIAFGESLTRDVVDTASEFVEIGLDSIMDNELLKKSLLCRRSSQLTALAKAFANVSTLLNLRLF